MRPLWWSATAQPCFLSLCSFLSLPPAGGLDNQWGGNERWWPWPWEPGREKMPWAWTWAALWRELGCMPLPQWCTTCAKLSWVSLLRRRVRHGEEGHGEKECQEEEGGRAIPNGATCHAITCSLIEVIECFPFGFLSLSYFSIFLFIFVYSCHEKKPVYS
jgi:hypothetical protein